MCSALPGSLNFQFSEEYLRSPINSAKCLKKCWKKLINAEGLERTVICAENVSKLGFLLRAEQKLFRLVGEGEALCYQHIFVYRHLG